MGPAAMDKATAGSAKPRLVFTGYQKFVVAILAFLPSSWTS
jgi:hypothetical protein